MGTHRLSVAGMKNKVVIDYEERVSLTYEGTNEIPTHPNVKGYDITAHKQVFVPVRQLTPYEYSPQIKDNLILPQSSIDLLDVLIDGNVDLMQDIVEGKTGGIIVLATGAPGLGKTLTAEVYSEIMQRPLYIVQSSQLGISVKELEDNLRKILNRAARWNAILMIDEADTYIHKRGNDIVQNCIVGVFLRLLEYYKGVLFMTSNLPDVVDDAILSRCTAHLHYDNPTQDEAYKIWEIQLNLNKVKHKDADIRKVITKHPYLGGRDIKNMAKMMTLYLDKKKKEKGFSMQLFEKLLPFMNFSSKKEQWEKEQKLGNMFKN
jgi:SpoVK/Ycf46/Vps4 family AAA+-type ATPase